MLKMIVKYQNNTSQNDKHNLTEFQKKKKKKKKLISTH